MGNVEDGGSSDADLFEVVWDALVEVLGTATTATLIRRAASRAQTKSPELEALAVVADALEYRVAVPPTWKTSPGPSPAFCHLLSELVHLLEVLAGPIIVRRLRTAPTLHGAFRYVEEAEQ